ncbi:pyridoxine/pyridoxamine 5'-phosphate oxidase [Marivirga arenosa]|uniref:Pyridoxal 5'-phosphate synthase n=1 Tax=Marivirga arenosa TaxID=3059076 RepID=A0AA49JDG6_9BACT|nr:pyridoxal 5'-phosphate synthase [Marivirga sp. BKB1-2]WKK83331.2 pyridoxal 5'-phosphate synthase [Marivirga sp. BKB1-2]
MINSPIALFNNWLADELSVSKVNIPTACCLSTIGLDKYPNARFVSFKDIVDNKLIITGSLSSRKALEISANNKVALTFWWTETERQIRIQGEANPINKQLADKYFSERNRESQIVSIVSRQGEELKNKSTLNEQYLEISQKFENHILSRPDSWGGYAIEPKRIEFLSFNSTRFHDRILFEKQKGNWVKSTIQP